MTASVPIKRALITGITGQDGSYLAELLLVKGLRGARAHPSLVDVQHRAHRPHLPAGPAPTTTGCSCTSRDLTDGSRLVTLLNEIQPDEVYNLAAQSHVRVSFDEPEYTGDIDRPRHDPAARGDPRDQVGLPLLPGVELRDVRRDARRRRTRTRRSTRVRPTASRRSTRTGSRATTARPTACSRSNGILFNHESPRRGGTFVTRKITRAVARIKAGLQDELYLGNLDAVRDWGYAPEYVEGMWRMLQHDEPDRLRARHEHRVHGEGLPASSRSSTSARLGEVRHASTSATCARPRSTR